MKKLLSFILTSIVDNPDKIEVSSNQEEDGTIILTAEADPEDMGKIIGKKGKIIRAIRTLLKVKAVKNKQRVIFNLQEE